MFNRSDIIDNLVPTGQYGAVIGEATETTTDNGDPKLVLVFYFQHGGETRKATAHLTAKNPMLAALWPALGLGQSDILSADACRSKQVIACVAATYDEQYGHRYKVTNVLPLVAPTQQPTGVTPELPVPLQPAAVITSEPPTPQPNPAAVITSN